MGAGRCLWGGYTDQIVCNIHGEEHGEDWDLFQIWHLANHSGNLPILADHSRWSPLSFCNIWQAAKISWHAAKSTSPDPLWSWIDQNLAPVTKRRCRNLFFVLFLPWPLTFDLDLPKTGMLSSMSTLTPKIMSIGSLAAAGEVVTVWHTDGKNYRPLLWIINTWPAFIIKMCSTYQASMTNADYGINEI